MPLMDGLQATRAIYKLFEEEPLDKNGEPCKMPTIVAMTADNSDKNRELWLKEGVHYFMGKPCDPNQLKTVLEITLDRPL